jgi:hypothetical protein
MGPEALDCAQLEPFHVHVSLKSVSDDPDPPNSSRLYPSETIEAAARGAGPTLSRAVQLAPSQSHVSPA